MLISLSWNCFCLHMLRHVVAKYWKKSMFYLTIVYMIIWTYTLYIQNLAFCTIIPHVYGTIYPFQIHIVIFEYFEYLFFILWSPHSQPEDVEIHFFNVFFSGYLASITLNPSSHFDKSMPPWCHNSETFVF